MATGISTTDARGLFTKKLVAVYRERKRPLNFLRSFFANEEAYTKEVSIEVERGRELIAVDVERGTEGNRNQFTKSTEKIIIPPYYREFFDITQLAIYDRAIGSSDPGAFAALLSETTDRIGTLQDKIERSYEKQCGDVMQTGIITLNNGITIDYRRKPGSFVVKTPGSTTWDQANVSPYDDIQAGCEFIRTIGKSTGGQFNAIFGDAAWTAFLKNNVVTGRNNIFHINLDAIAPPQMNAMGALYQGRITCGSYIVDMWTYPEIYETLSNGVKTQSKYINKNNVIILPQVPKFVLAFGAIPRLLDQPAQKGAFVVSDFVSERLVSHIYDIQSAGVAVPVAVDQIYTLTPTNVA